MALRLQAIACLLTNQDHIRRPASSRQRSASSRLRPRRRAGIRCTSSRTVVVACSIIDWISLSPTLGHHRPRVRRQAPPMLQDPVRVSPDDELPVVEIGRSRRVPYGASGGSGHWIAGLTCRSMSRPSQGAQLPAQKPGYPGWLPGDGCLREPLPRKETTLFRRSRQPRAPQRGDLRRSAPSRRVQYP